MSFVNPNKRQVQVKIVYYGPGRGGKTTNLEYLYRKLGERVKADLISIKTEGDRTLFFDFLPFELGKIKGYDVMVQLYTVPGQVKYNATRQLVLKGVDGLVFVADSMALRRKQNFLSLDNLHKNLVAYKKSIFKIPLVLQYNKRDLEETDAPLLPIELLKKDLNSQLQVPDFAASALNGTNVTETFKKIMAITMATIRKQLE